MAEPPASSEEETATDVEALLEAGEEEGILEETDRDLVRSAVEFGDKLVREVMTPRPRVFAVSESITLEEFIEQLRVAGKCRLKARPDGLVVRLATGNSVTPKNSVRIGIHNKYGMISGIEQDGIRRFWADPMD